MRIPALSNAICEFRHPYIRCGVNLDDTMKWIDVFFKKNGGLK
jgi:hypothetical protein